MIYLDHAATTPMRPGVWESMTDVASVHFGNSSGVHGVSRDAKNRLEQAREDIAALIGATPGEIVFTSGGTESDNLALKGAVWNRDRRNGVVVSASEHDAVLDTVDVLGRLGAQTRVVGVDSNGHIDEEQLLAAVDDRTVVVSVMMVNNETGAVHDLEAIARLVKESDPGVLIHTDAVQAFSSEDLDVSRLGVDLLSVTGHKFGGPKGAGILYVREGTVLEAVLHGGGQERGRRSGTHDVASVVGLAYAMRLAAEDRDRFRIEVGGVRDQLEKTLLAAIDGLQVNTPLVDRSPHHLNVRVPGVRNETLLMRMDRAGVAASAGSACQSGAAEVSHVLEAMGLTAEEARESIRFSFGWNSTANETAEAAEVVIDLVGELR